MTGRAPVCEDAAAIAERLAEIQRARMAAIAGCTCPQRDAAGNVVHTPLCPLRAEPASKMEMAREAISRSRARLAQHTLPIFLAMALAFEPHLLVPTVFKGSTANHEIGVQAPLNAGLRARSGLQKRASMSGG